MTDVTGDRTARAEVAGLVRSPRFLAILSITSILPLSVAVVSPALPGMASGLGISDARIGLVVTAITLPPMILAPVVGVASDMFGRRTVAIPGLLLFGLAGVAITLVDSFPVILGLRGIQGIAMAGIGPLTVTLVGDLYEGSVRTTAQGIRSSTGGLVLMVVPLIAGALAGLAWQYPFYLYGAAFLVVGIVYWYVPETAGDMATERSLRGTLRVYARSIAGEFGDPRLVVVMLGGFFRFFSLFAFLTFVPIFAVRSLGASPFLAGFVVAMAGIRILLGPTAGWWVSRYSRRWTLLASIAIQIVVFALIPLAPNVWVLAGLAVCYGAGDALFDPVVNDATTSMVAAHNRNGIVGGLRVLKEAGKTAAPVALGVALALGGYPALFYSLVVALAGYAVAVVLVLDSVV
jgi:MFS family permease